MTPAMECSTHSRVVSVDYWFFVNSSIIAFIMVRSSLELTHSSSLSLAASGGGGPCIGGMVSKK
jgi:hypothetical protein